MALIGVNVFETKDYISKQDTDRNDPTIFKIGLLDSQIKSWIIDRISDFEMSSDNLDDKAKVTFRINERNLALVKFGLKGIENLIDPQTKKPVSFKPDVINKFGKSYEVIPDRVLNMLSLQVITELAEEILKETKLSDEEIKN